MGRTLKKLEVLVTLVLFLTAFSASFQQVSATSLSTDYYQFRHAATYNFDVRFYGRPVYFPYWAQEHVWDRHVLGYDMDDVYETTFYPLGQYVKGRHLPETMDGYDVVYLIEDAIEYGRAYFYGDRVVILYYLPYYQYRNYGISMMKVVLEKEYYYGYTYYNVITAYPLYGPDVAVYEDHHWAN
ncbi:hypothetical protein [Thermococcus stetteri]|uniref:hypothetical protein n=1 Tax=Thermococcus stetteri TaxID=49900 RepID=UPI001AE93F21|nr:hypothetical protein [Thermococcus stetteri]MBP1911841.1 hypothetical protein [Thermococcus stetteri]